MENQDTQSENSTPPWSKTEEELDTRVGPEYDVAEPFDGTPSWFRFNAASIGGETEQEKAEMAAAKKEQIELGIGQPQKQPPQKFVATKDTHAKSQEFVNDLKKDPSQMKNDFVPKIRDSKTGKIRKLGPNDKCPCGSGKKFKKCHGRGR